MLNRAFKQVPGVIDVTGYGGTVKQYQILVDTRLMKQYGVTMEQVEDAIKKSNANVGGDILALGTQSHNVRAIGLLGKGVDPLDPAKVARSAEIEAKKLDDIRKVVVDTSDDGTPIFVRQIAQVVIGHQPRLGIVGRGTEDDVVEGIVLMRKYEKSLPTAEAVAEKMEEIEREHLLPKGMKLTVFNQRTDLVEVTTHNVLHNLVEGMILVIVVLFVFLGDSGERRHRGDHDPAGALVLGDGALCPGQVGQSAVDRRGRFRDHRRQLGDHRREHLPAHHGARRRPHPAVHRSDHRGFVRDRAVVVLLDDDHRLRVHPACSR